MKQIVAFVNKLDKQDLNNDNIYFASSLSDFEVHLTKDTIPVLSIVLAASKYKEVKRITQTHKDLKFYFLQKRRTGLNVKTSELFLRADSNTEPQLMLPRDIISLL